MGYLPVIIAVGGFFGLWVGLMLNSFKRYYAEAKKADEARRQLLSAAGTDLKAVDAIPDADLLKAFTTLNLGHEPLRAEVAFRKARRTYNKLINMQPYKQFAAATGYGAWE